MIDCWWAGWRWMSRLLPIAPHPIPPRHLSSIVGPSKQQTQVTHSFCIFVSMWGGKEYLFDV